MITKIKCDGIVTPSGILGGYLYAADGRITEISGINKPADIEYDYTGSYLMPGFIDIHTHGAGGHPFLTEQAEVVATACDFHLKHGTTTILPTLSASPIDIMEKSVAAIKAARDRGLTKANIVGAHLEGPYLSADQCGAQCPDFITPPIADEYVPLVEKYGDAIARWTYAPENDDGNFAKFLAGKGIIASAGHTNAKYPDMDTAVANGCNLITHLYSCTSTVTRSMGFRSLGVIESAFLRDELNVELIADGKHLPRELVQMIVKIKGVDQVAAVTDSLYPAGTDLKEGCTDGVSFIVEGGVCRLPDRSAFAGSIATADRLLQVLHRDCGIALIQAVKMLTAVPARIMGLDVGVIAQGRPADLVLLDENLQARDVFVGGKKVS